MDSNTGDLVQIWSFPPFPPPSRVLEQSPAALPLPSFLFSSFSPSSFSLNAFPTRESRRTGLPSRRVCSLFLPPLPLSYLLPLGLARASSRATMRSSI